MSLEDLIGVARSAGYDLVRMRRFPDSHVFLRAYTNFRSKEIFLNEDFFETPPNGDWSDIEPRARFDLAHELGHIILGHPVRTRHECETVEDLLNYQKEEWLANYFAGALLMDEHRTRETLRRTRYSIGALADEFRVTLHTAAHRLLVVSRQDELIFRFVQVGRVPSLRDGQESVRVLKSYAANADIFPAPATGSFACKEWVVCKSLETRKPMNGFAVFRDRSFYEKLFVMSQFIPAHPLSQRLRDLGLMEIDTAISIGCSPQMLDVIDGSPGEEVYSESTVGHECTVRCPSFSTCAKTDDELMARIVQEDLDRGYTE